MKPRFDQPGLSLEREEAIEADRIFYNHGVKEGLPIPEEGETASLDEIQTIDLAQKYKQAAEDAVFVAEAWSIHLRNSRSRDWVKSEQSARVEKSILDKERSAFILYGKSIIAFEMLEASRANQNKSSDAA